MGLIWVLSAPDGPHVGTMKFDIRDIGQIPCNRQQIAQMKDIVRQWNYLVAKGGYPYQVES